MGLEEYNARSADWMDFMSRKEMTHKIRHLDEDRWKYQVKELGKRKRFSSVHFSHLSCPTLCDHMDHSSQASLSITNSWSPPKSMSIKSVMSSSHLILCHPLLLLPSIFPSIRVFSSESALLIRWPKYWSFSFSICPSNEYSGLISFRIDWFDLAVQGTLKSLLQHHTFKSINSLALSFLYSPTLTSIHDYWKNHSLDYMDHFD